MDDLLECTRFELVFLQELYRLAAWETSPIDMPDLVMWYDDEKQPFFEVHCRGCAYLSDWRPGFMEVGKPLIFVTAFKLMDLLVCWVIEQEIGVAAPQKTEVKYKLLSEIPRESLLAVFSDNYWLFERLLSMYPVLVRVRNTLAHRSDFEVGPGGMRVKAGRAEDSAWVDIGDQELRDVSAFLLNVIWGIVGVVETNDRWRRLVKILCDRLSRFHKLKLFGQKELVLGVFRVDSSLLEDVVFDLDVVKMHMDRRGFSSDKPVVADTIFDLEVNVTGPNPQRFVVPWDCLQEFPSGIPVSKLLNFRVN